MKMSLDKENARHIEILNKELGGVQTDVAVIKNDISTIKTNHEEFKLCNSKEHDKLNAKLWWILGVVVLTELINIGINLGGV